MEVWIVTHSWTRRGKDTQRLKSVSPNKRGGIHMQTIHIQQSCWCTEERRYMILDCWPLDWWQPPSSDCFKCAWMQKHIRTLNTPYDIAHADTCTHMHTPLPQMGYPAVGFYITMSELWSFIEMEIPQRWCRINHTEHRSVLYYWTNILNGDIWKVLTFISVFWAFFVL